jgi:RimJ/RimL family protein N-acetyltransferase
LREGKRTPGSDGADPWTRPRFEPWGVVTIHKADRVAIGGIGFQGGPDEAGMVEIGYNIVPEYEGLVTSVFI